MKILKLAIYMAFITLISSLLLFKINTLTSPIIKESEQKKEKMAFNELIPKASKFETLNYKTENTKSISKAISSKGETIGYILKVYSKGYADNIILLVGIAEQKITGISILSQNETPGLGALATSPKKMPGNAFSFLEQFINKTLSSDFTAKKDIIAITGATITSQAICDGIKTALIEYQKFVETN